MTNAKGVVSRKIRDTYADSLQAIYVNYRKDADGEEDWEEADIFLSLKHPAGPSGWEFIGLQVNLATLLNVEMIHLNKGKLTKPCDLTGDWEAIYPKGIHEPVSAV